MSNPVKRVRVDAFENGEPFVVMGKVGERPSDAVVRSLARRKGVRDVVLSFSEPTPSGGKYTAKWFDPRTEVFCESEVEIWR